MKFVLCWRYKMNGTVWEVSFDSEQTLKNFVSMNKFDEQCNNGDMYDYFVVDFHKTRLVN